MYHHSVFTFTPVFQSVRIRISLPIPPRVKYFLLHRYIRESFHSLKSRETVEELIFYITGRQGREGEEGGGGGRNGCRGARAHLSEVNAHARREHYFVRPIHVYVSTPAPRGVEIKNCRAIFSNHFAHRSHASIGPIPPVRQPEERSVNRTCRFFPNSRRMFPRADPIAKVE